MAVRVGLGGGGSKFEKNIKGGGGGREYRGGLRQIVRVRNPLPTMPSGIGQFLATENLLKPMKILFISP